MFVQPILRRMVMKNGLLALLLLSLVAAIPACRQRDCLDKDRGCETKCNPCGWFKCKPKCEKEEKVRKPRKKCESKCNPCGWFKCKPKCKDEEMMEEEEMMPPMREEVSRERMVREEVAPRRMVK
jgi:hypothetical protein